MSFTLLDIAKRNNSDAITGLIEEGMSPYQPEIKMSNARTINGINYKTLIRTGRPAGAFRNVNEGGVEGHSTYVNLLVECYVLDFQVFVDKAIADSSEDGASAFLADEATGVMQGNLELLSKQFYYGTNNDSKGFRGIKQMVSSSLVYDAGGTGSQTTEVFGVKWGSRDVRWVVGNGGNLALSDVEVINKQDANKKTYPAYWQYMDAKIGLQVGNKYSISAIKNLTDTKPLNDHILAELISECQSRGVTMDAFYMSAKALKQLRESREATNALGTPAPFPTEAYGIPIHITSGISNSITAW